MLEKMDARNNNRVMSFVVLIVVLAGLYVSWQLLGLRFTNHDDIFYHLHSWVFADDYIGFSQNTADKQARLQAYINMPISLWMNHLGGSWLGDVFGIGMFAILYVSFIWMMKEVGNLKNSAIISAFTLFMFPLHYYFMIPQAYSVMGVWGLAFAFIAAASLASYLKKPTSAKIVVSVVTFIASLWGPEYNVILHPFLLLVVVICSGKVFGKKLIKVSIPFLIGWGLTVTVYILYSVTSRSAGGDGYGRVSLSFDLIAWVKTYILLTQKSFVPFALWDGVQLVSASAQGGPDVPAILTYSSIFKGLANPSILILVFMVSLTVSVYMLRKQALDKASVLRYASICLLIAVIPCAVLAGSAHYQSIVLKGYLQGHLASFYVQLGCSGLIFIISAYLYNSARQSLKLPLLVVLSTMIAFFISVTFVYNNINRQVMVANAQKWEAFENIVTYIKSDHEDMRDNYFYGPAFWTFSGVSAIPGVSVYTGSNYWTEYSRSILKYPLQFESEKQKNKKNFIYTAYFSMPEGVPISVISRKVLMSNRWETTLIASRRISANISYEIGESSLSHVLSGKWTCEKECSIVFYSDEGYKPESLSIIPADSGSDNIVFQFFLPRQKQYGLPFNSKKMKIENFNVESWGPQKAKVGEVPNPQANNSAGFWIKFRNQDDVGDVKVLLGGISASSISVEAGLITAAIPSTLFNTAGKRKLVIVQSSGSKLEIGDVEIEP